MTYGNMQGFGTPPEEEKKSRKMLWLGFGAATLVFFCIGIGVLAAWIITNDSRSETQSNNSSNRSNDDANEEADADTQSNNDANEETDVDSQSNDSANADTGNNASNNSGSANNIPVPFLSVVQIRAQFYDDGQLLTGWTGSGTIISSDGYILTNAHVVLPDKNFPVDALVIALTIAEDLEPVALYYAEVMQADVNLDLAVIRIFKDITGKDIGPEDLALPFVELGNSDELHLGDDIIILGYPGIGGDTITLTRGEISGFTAEDPYGDRAFIKTSATIAGGNSGGLAVGDDGRLIGVPTQLGYGGDDEIVDCRVLADTNRDGVVDSNDSCIPTGGYINALRPIDLAIPLIEAAQRGEVNITDTSPVESEVDIPAPDEGGSGDIVLLEDDFSTHGGAADWTAGDRGGDGYARYLNDEFHINVIPDNMFIWSNANVNLSDMIMRVNVRIVLENGQGDYGYICRYQDANNFYALEITEDGYYSIWMYENGEFRSLVEWQHSSLIPQDNNWHVLSAACVDNYLVLAVDGEVIAEVQDDTFSSGDIGLIAGTWEQGNFTVAFDDLYVTAP